MVPLCSHMPFNLDGSFTHMRAHIYLQGSHESSQTSSRSLPDSALPHHPRVSHAIAIQRISSFPALQTRNTRSTTTPPHRPSSQTERLGPVDPSFRALSGRLKFTVGRQKFNKDSLFTPPPRVRLSSPPDNPPSPPASSLLLYYSQA